jgi:hypothetical protein
MASSDMGSQTQSSLEMPNDNHSIQIGQGGSTFSGQTAAHGDVFQVGNIRAEGDVHLRKPISFNSTP